MERDKYYTGYVLVPKTKDVPIDKWSKSEISYVKDKIHFYWGRLIDEGYQVLPIREVEFNYRTSSWGLCKHHSASRYNKEAVTICISRYSLLEGEEFLKTVILHELCHAIKECTSEHHGPKWKKNAREISKIFNVQITRTTKSKKTTKFKKTKAYKWQVKCEKCNATWKYKNKINFVKDALNNHGLSWTCECGSKGYFMAREINRD